MTVKELRAGNNGARDAVGMDQVQTNAPKVGRWTKWGHLLSPGGFEGEDAVRCQKSGECQQGTDSCW